MPATSWCVDNLASTSSLAHPLQKYPFTYDIMIDPVTKEGPMLWKMTEMVSGLALWFIRTVLEAV